MKVEFLKRGFFQRLLGIPATGKPERESCWNFDNGQLTIDLGQAPELAAPGGAVRIEGGNLPKRVLVIRTEGGEYRAFHNRCTHLGHRRLDPVPGTETVQCCSVNKSTYDEEGRKIFGPAPQPITRYALKEEQGKLIISIT